MVWLHFDVSLTPQTPTQCRNVRPRVQTTHCDVCGSGVSGAHPPDVLQASCGMRGRHVAREIDRVWGEKSVGSDQRPFQYRLRPCDHAYRVAMSSDGNARASTFIQTSLTTNAGRRDIEPGRFK